MSTLTTHYSLIKPAVNSATDQDLWGGYLNDDMDSIDSLLWTAANWVKRDVTTTGSGLKVDRPLPMEVAATFGPLRPTPAHPN